MKFNRIFAIVTFMIIGSIVYSQAFDTPLEGFSRKKAAYLYMEDGSLKEGILGGFKRSKGLIKIVKMKSRSGRKIQIDPARISHMYIAPSAMAKLGAAMEVIYDMNKWNSKLNYDTTLIKEGYVYFEKVKTENRKGTDDLMLQLLNASFSPQIKVYHDPMAGETTSLVSGGGLTVAGGRDKSYYILKKGEDVAYRLKKKDYQRQFDDLFGDCPEFMRKHRGKAQWADFPKHVFEYTEMMENK